MGWAVGILLAFIIALLIKIIADLRKLRAAGAHNGPPAATNNGIAAMQGALALIEQIRSEDRKATEAECKQLKDLLTDAQAGHVSTLSLTPIKNAIELLC